MGTAAEIEVAVSAAHFGDIMTAVLQIHFRNGITSALEMAETTVICLSDETRGNTALERKWIEDEETQKCGILRLLPLQGNFGNVGRTVSSSPPTKFLSTFNFLSS